MSDDHPVLYVTDQFGQSRPWDGECLLCQRDALRSRLAEAEALLREALPAVQSYARKHGRAVVAAARRNDADHVAKHAAIEQSAWGLADKIRAYLPPDSASVEGEK